MLWEILHKASTLAMLSFVVSSMLAMGTGLTVGEIVEALRNLRLIIVALLANFVLMPLGALTLAKVLWLDEPLGVGLLLLGCAAGAPFLPKLAMRSVDRHLLGTPLWGSLLHGKAVFLGSPSRLSVRILPPYSLTRS